MTEDEYKAIVTKREADFAQYLERFLGSLDIDRKWGCPHTESFPTRIALKELARVSRACCADCSATDHNDYACYECVH